MPTVHAVLVAVEAYHAGPALPPLNGPAADAARYRTWLRAHGVPDGSVTVFASPLSDASDLGPRVRPAQQQQLYDFITGELPTLDADQLIVVWGGHGVVDPDGRRRLFYADATADDKRNLDFNELAKSLTTTYYPRLKRQLLIVDACQTEARFITTLPHQALPAGPSLAVDRVQEILFAAGPGQVAINNSRRATGLFSQELLGLLGAPATGFPPAADHLAERLSRRFAELRTADATSQIPQYLWHRTAEGEGLDIAPPPRPAAPPSLAPITAAMQQVDELISVPLQQRLIAGLPREIRAAVPHTGFPIIDLVALVRACARFPGGRAALVEVLSTNLPDDPARARVLAAIDEHWPAP
ncbi:effector-associated domain 2-containing protein [Dactylosporangium sp. CA-233914]|uniref:effector-associated domain 2-containing protein n=1 Tax=Dactylosporangium sp. CA-233914 TaxID=3239934 RepID=UPI003D928786